jgi:hypothetical protein
VVFSDVYVTRGATAASDAFLPLEERAQIVLVVIVLIQDTISMGTEEGTPSGGPSKKIHPAYHCEHEDRVRDGSDGYDVHPDGRDEDRYDDVDPSIPGDSGDPHLVGGQKFVYSGYSEAGTKSIPLASWWLRKRHPVEL